MDDGLRAGVGAPTLAVDVRRVGRGTGAFFAGVSIEGLLVATTGGDLAAGTADIAPSDAALDVDAGAVVETTAVEGIDGGADIFVAEAGGTGAFVIEVGRGRCFAVAVDAVVIALVMADATEGCGATEVGRGGRVVTARPIAAMTAGDGAAEVGRGGRFVVDAVGIRRTACTVS